MLSKNTEKTCIMHSYKMCSKPQTKTITGLKVNPENLLNTFKIFVKIFVWSFSLHAAIQFL